MNLALQPASSSCKNNNITRQTNWNRNRRSNYGHSSLSLGILPAYNDHPVGQRDFPEFHSPSPSLRPSDRPPLQLPLSTTATAAGAAAVIAIHNSENDDTATAVQKGRREGGERRDREPFQFGSTVRLTAKCRECAIQPPPRHGKHVSVRSEQPPPPHDRQHD